MVDDSDFDWDYLVKCVESENMDGFTDWIYECMQQNKEFHFKRMQKGVIENCIQNGESQKRRILSHLLVGIIPESLDAQVINAVKENSVKLFSMCNTVEDAKLAVKIASVFNLSVQDLESNTNLVQLIDILLLDSNTATPAIAFLMHFPELNSEFEARPIMTKLLCFNHEALAERWVATLDHKCKCELVEECLLQGKLRSASSAVYKFKLQKEYPHVERMYRESTLRKLLEKELWGAAGTFAGEDKEFQEMAVKAMALSGEIILAREYVQLFKLPESIVEIDPEVLAAEEAVRMQKYLQLAIPFENVLFIDTDAQCLDVKRELMEANMVGVDVEWKPVGKRGSSKASILQVAMETKVFLFDLFALGGSAEFDNCLSSFWNSPNSITLGFCVGDDLSKLARSYPELQAFKSVNGVLDLQRLWNPYAAKNNIVNTSSGENVGLSHVSERIFGKPLDKSMQVSNWEARPLSRKQLCYASQDAHILLRLYKEMIEGEKGLGVEAVEKHLFKFQAQTRKRDNNGNGNGSGSGGDIGDQGEEVPEKLLGLDEDALELEGSSDLSVLTGLGEHKCGLRNRVAPKRVIGRLDECRLGHAFEWLEADGSDKASSMGAAKCLGVPVNRIGKSMALRIKGQNWLLVLRGDHLVDLRKVAKEVGVSRRHVKMASKEECIKYFGYVPGTLPPFGHSHETSVLIDTSLNPQSDHTVHCGSGSPDAIVSLTFEELLEVANGRVADVAKSDEESDVDQGVTEELEPTSRLKSGEVRFTLDSMLGRLCRWMRGLGVDAEYVPQEIKREAVPEYAIRAMSNGRMFLTRNTILSSRSDCIGVYLLGSDVAEEQLKEIAKHFGIRFDSDSLLSRCTKCNASDFLYFTPQDAEKPAEVSERIYQMVDKFWRCQNCSKVYWMGPKSDQMVKHLKEMFGDDDESEPAAVPEGI